MGGYFPGASGRTAVITGASEGIGASFAERMAGEGFRCVLVARRADLLEELAERLERTHGIPVEVLPADLSGEAGIAALVRRVEGDPSIDVLVNAAGFGTRGMFAELEPGKIESMVMLHAMATARLCRAALPAMIRNRRGWIINVSSLGAYFTAPHYVVYSATKSFITVLTRGLRLELAGTGVRVQALCPGLTRTGFLFTDEFKNVNYRAIPSLFWMSPGAVTRRSLAALKWNRAVVVPGIANRIWAWGMNMPLMGPVFRRIMGFLAAASY